MLKAGALFYSVVISLIMAIISASIIMLSGISTNVFQQATSRQRLELNASSGLNLLLSDQSLVPENEKKIVDLYGMNTDSVQLSRHYWGAFEIVSCMAFSKSDEVVKMALAGHQPDSAAAYSLYLPDLDKPIAVCGDTKIKGHAFLPKAGVKTAYIEGQNYRGNSLVYGPVSESKKELPSFNKELLSRISSVPEAGSEEDSVMLAFPESSETVLSNSFFNRTLFMESNQALYINFNASGNICFVSKAKIVIEAEAALNNVVLYAPQIIIKKGFRGALQAFATDTILLEENVNLSYPSVLGIVQGQRDTVSSAVLLGKQDTVCGNVFVCANNLVRQNIAAGISVAEKAFIMGSVYTNGYAEIKGSIYGSLMCKRVLLRTGSTVYENHFLNAVIDRTQLSANYVGIDIMDEKQRKGIVKWLK